MERLPPSWKERTNEEVIRAHKLVMEPRASFVKTSTGFANGGATLEDVKLMRRTVGKDFGVKAGGGIRTLEDALSMIEAGTNRLGTSGSVVMMEDFKNTRKEENRWEE